MVEREEPFETLVVPETCRHRFEIREILSRGGMGIVCIAWDKICGRPVALKFLRSELRDHAESNDRLIREAVVMGRLRHPGVPSVHDMGIDPDGRGWYAMGLIDGCELREEIDRCHRDRPVKIDRYWRQARSLLKHLVNVARTVQWAHEAGFLHRDLKPANIFVSRHGESVVLDWGLAGRCRGKAGDSSSVVDSDYLSMLVDRSRAGPEEGLSTALPAVMHTAAESKLVSDEMATVANQSSAPADGRNGGGGDSARSSANGSSVSSEHFRVLESDLTNHLARLGTPAYMAPEMRSGNLDQLDERTDIFLLGSTLFQILTGKPPFHHDDRPNDHLRADLNRAVVSSDLIEICIKAMRKSMANRYESAAAFADDIEHYLADDAIIARPDTVARRSGRVLRRHWRFATVAVVLLFAATALAGLATVLEQRTNSMRLQNELLAAKKSRAESESQRQRREAELAHLYRDSNALDRIIDRRPVGWSGTANQLVASLESRLEPDDPLEPHLRGQRLRIDLGYDVRDLTPELGSGPTALRFAPGCFAYHHASDQIAIGQAKAGLYFGLSLAVGRGLGEPWDLVASSSVVQGTLNLISSDPQPGYRAVCFSPDGDTLYAGTRSGDVFCWQRNASNPPGDWSNSTAASHLLETIGTVQLLVPAADGRHLWVATNELLLHRLDLSVAAASTVCFQPTAEPPRGLVTRKVDSAVRSIAVLESDRLVVSPSRGPAIDGQTLKDVSGPSFDAMVATPHPNKTSLILSGNNQELIIADATSGDVTAILAGPSPRVDRRNVHQTISPDGAWLLRSIQWRSGADLEYWNLANGTRLATIPLADEIEPCLAICDSPVEAWVAGNLPHVFRIEAGHDRLTQYWPHSIPIRQITPIDGGLLAFARDRTVMLSVDGPSRELLPHVIERTARMVDVSGETRREIIAAACEDADNSLRFYQLDTEKGAKRLRPMCDLAMSGKVQDLEFDDSGTLWCVVAGNGFDLYDLVGLSTDGTVHQRIETLQKIDLEKVLDPSCMAVGSGICAVGLRTGSIHIFDLVNARQTGNIWSGGSSRVVDLAFQPPSAGRQETTPSGQHRLLACSRRDGGLVLLAVDATGESEPINRVTLDLGASSPVSTMIWIGHDHFACGRENGRFEVYGVRDGRWVQVLEATFETQLATLAATDSHLIMHFEGHRSARLLPLDYLERLLTIDVSQIDRH
jgi:serine/threonine protein kinase/WD40 repeat protein